MDISQKDRRMEGWLYVFGANRIGVQYSRKRYFILEDNCLNCFRSAPLSNTEVPLKSALIDSCIKVTDNETETVNKKELFVFILYNTSNHNDQLKLGARASEEAEKWIHSINEATKEVFTKHDEIPITSSRRKWQSFRLGYYRGTSCVNPELLDPTAPSTTAASNSTSDVIESSPWTIFGCSDGLRLFKEAKDGYVTQEYWDDHPAIMAVGVVDANSEIVFRTIMSLGPSRTDIVERLDGHTDIIHKQLNVDWLPWGMKRRDLLLRRYWRKEDDGSYVILYHSVVHSKFPPQTGCIRACLKSGGYVITPVNQGKQSVVKHMLAIDWKCWKSYIFASSGKSITIRMLGKIAALREFYKAKLGNYPFSDFSLGEMTNDIEFPQSEVEEIKHLVESTCENKKVDDSKPEDLQSFPIKSMQQTISSSNSTDAIDEFFDVPDQSECDDTCSMEKGTVLLYEEKYNNLSTAALFVKKLRELTEGCKDSQDMVEGEHESFNCIGSLKNDPDCVLPCSWSSAEPSTFLIRGYNYLEDNQKIKAESTLMKLVATDWLYSDKREDDLSGRSNSFIQKYAEHDQKEFFFVVNLQVPGSTKYNLVLYYILEFPVEKTPLLENFVKGDDIYRNSRFKLIPYISKGSWIVKQSVGKQACLIGQALNINYFQGKNYIEVDIDVGSSTVARGVINLLLGYLTNLVIEMAFVLQANTQEELPEFLLGTCRLNHLDASKAVSVAQKFTT